MMWQNWYVIWLVERICFVLGFLSHNKVEYARNLELPCMPEGSLQKEIPEFIIDTSDILKVVFLKTSHDIKTANTIVFNPSFDEFHIRFDGSFLTLGKTKYNKEIARLFGTTSTVMTSADGSKCFNINQPAMETERLKNGGRLWKWRGDDEVLRYQQ